HRHRDPNTDAPNHPTPTAGGVKKHGHRHLLRHPACFEEAVEAVSAGASEIKARRVGEVEAAVNWPPVIAQHSAAVCKIVVAISLALRPPPQIARADQPQTAAHAHTGADPYENALKPQRALEAPVDQPAVE